ncbi:tRNA1(Val) A37 N6-methylase TrmN6 [Humitalea rosea]|uniref:tRNA1(Val) A37 N6-methylase TrmN6 n=1 Tax=Humitalea rosea TaxID=990373 RepID=A0A2W7IUQ7_9PROT|nr:methyltransferase [Humitalea rosea]PZW51189.1 tRNA1(Val) A37 N6-methylase TrmN6 [Humitalea rosea]
MTEDRLLGGRIRLVQPQSGLKAGLDAVMLAAAIPAKPGETVLDAGCGAGAVFLCLMARVPGLRVIALERDPELAALARENAALNGFADQVQVIEGDVADATLPPVQHSCANPPFWPDGTAPPAVLRAGATHAGATGLLVWVRALANPLRAGGSATLVLPATRFSEAASALRLTGFGDVGLYPLWPRAGVAARRVLLTARRGGRGPDRVTSGLILHDGAGWSAAAEAVLRDAQALPG